LRSATTPRTTCFLRAHGKRITHGMRFARRHYTEFDTPIEAMKVLPAGSNMLDAMRKVESELAAQGLKGYIIPCGGSNALGGLA
jgi:hypothetical protein